ncbi:anaerobic ribonucleoside-triphosphate reductase [Thalassotalea sp. LPB0316]|uniref:anaerobic ribonucleoside-triphosphate reductase n=1 Tax=Thalassotalea sp. LPB0316 TaxID=2769490 RepID=UPI0018672217|nr:anaerobic ribonucleoside-triphosphate reductase [Thalassotalea sp. LPB0316]QOL26438.1 anaerobic ribonucleoside-triphosphate reductase [Thalassotalea sp. LPB0316]
MYHIDDSLIDEKINFITNYIEANNAADGSKYDANANISSKNIATLESELNKDINIAINRRLLTNKIAEIFDQSLAQQYIDDINQHLIYAHDESSLKPYCVSLSMYPLLLDGLTKLGGESKAPKHLESFCGSFINMVFAVSAQFAGAVATVEFLTYFDYFARKDYGDDYLITAKSNIEAHLQHVVYSVNQPAAARGYQSVFWNISLFSESFLNAMFENFVFPCGDSPKWQTINQLQQFFIDWLGKERERAMLTYPVVTAALLTQDKQVADVEFAQFCSREMAKGNSFFVYMSDSADSLASCCRLRNEVADNSFSYTLGAGGVATGSINVITVNINKVVQEQQNLQAIIERVQKYQVAYRKLMEHYQDQGMLPVYDAGFIHLDKQFLTIGINGMVEAAESQGIEASNNKEYKAFVSKQLKVIYDANKAVTKQWGYKFNTEFVPAENLGVKNAKWDRKAGLTVERDCYNSYFYPVENDHINVVDKFILHGHELTQFLDGGSALHLNLDEAPDEQQYFQLYQIAAQTGCNYWTTNIKVTVCNQCGHIDKRTLHACSECHSEDVDWATRVIGYLKKVTSFSQARQKEHALRHYHKEPVKSESAA